MRSLLLLLAITISSTTFSQDYDSLPVASDSAFVVSNFSSNDSKANPDTLNVEARAFDENTVNGLKNDPELNYETPPTVAESFWKRFMSWLGQGIDSFFNKAVNTNWGKLFTYIAVMAVIVVLIMMMLKVNAFRILARGEGANTFNHNVIDDNIHIMDFDKLIQEAVAKNDHRLAVRLVFLFALKMLADKNLIHWHQGKTNHDYLDELNAEELKGGFNELNYYFEYAWYGNFNISQGMFAHVQGIFNDWKRKL